MMKNICGLILLLIITTFNVDNAFPSTQNSLAGKVLQVMIGGGYKYVYIEQSDSTKKWVAVADSNDTLINVGTYISFKSGMELAKFESKALNRRFDSVFFSDGVISNSEANVLNSNVNAYEISGDFQQIIINRWDYNIPASVKEIIKVKNFEFGSDISNTMFKMCTPDMRDSYRQCKTDKYGSKFLHDFKYGNSNKGIEATVDKNGALLAIRGILPLTDAIALGKILTEKYGEPSLNKSEKYYSEGCTGTPYLTSHTFWKDGNGTVIQLDSTYVSFCESKPFTHLGRITIMSKAYIDNIKGILIELNEKKKQEEEKEKKKAVDNL
jgi:hypothetical protein